MAAAAASELSLNDHPVDDFSANEMVCLESEHMVDVSNLPFLCFLIKLWIQSLFNFCLNFFKQRIIPESLLFLSAFFKYVT